MGKKKPEAIGKDISEDVADISLEVSAKIKKNALFFRQGIAEGTAVLPDENVRVKIDAAINVNGDSVLIGLKREDSKDWFTYVFMTNDLIQQCLVDFEERTAKAKPSQNKGD